jgi:hypothetical protein
MSKIILLLIILSGCASVKNATTLVVDDCGPAARPTLGVVFTIAPHGSGKGYLTSGSPYDVCPKITEAKMIRGYVEDLCINHSPRDKRECGSKSVFVITEVINE